jgi:hypothetical protein
MKIDAKEIEVNGVKYVPKGSEQKLVEKVDGLEYVLIRAYSAGVHVGYLKERKGDEVILLNTRRIFYWDGAASLSQLATEGVKKPQNCKFTVPVPQNTILGVIEIIPCTEAAQKNIAGVTEWKK